MTNFFVEYSRKFEWCVPFTNAKIVIQSGGPEVNVRPVRLCLYHFVPRLLCLWLYKTSS